MDEAGGIAGRFDPTVFTNKYNRVFSEDAAKLFLSRPMIRRFPKVGLATGISRLTGHGSKRVPLQDKNYQFEGLGVFSPPARV